MMKNNPMKYEKPNILGLLSGKNRVFANTDTVNPDPDDPIETEQPIAQSDEIGGDEWD